MSSRPTPFWPLILAAMLAPQASAAPSELAVVLVHGKWGMPQGLVQLERSIQERGYLVANPEWAWSGERLYDMDYATALKEMEGRVQALRTRGARRIAIVGQSLGANAAVAYVSSGRHADALALLSPGHFPEGTTGKRVRASVDRARRLVAAGRGAERASLEDVNQGTVRVLDVAAASYLSYYEPAGLGAVTINVRKLPQPIPVLVAVATSDTFLPQSRSFFQSAPAHPDSRYLTLESDHFELRDAVVKDLLGWLEKLRLSWGL